MNAEEKNRIRQRNKEERRLKNKRRIIKQNIQNIILKLNKIKYKTIFILR